MLPFALSLRPGVPVSEQVIYAVTRAVVRGQLRAGDPFPSVRALSQELKINPNTAQRIVSALVEQGTLAVRPGVGTVIADSRPAKGPGRRAVLEEDAERIVVAARVAGVSLQDLLNAIRRQWARIGGHE